MILQDKPTLEPYHFKAGHKPRTADRAKTPYSQAVELQTKIRLRAQDSKCTDMALAALVRAWDVLEERKRILRGIPLPGQLRPDLDPLQLLKALKRARERKPLELAPSSNGSSFVEAEETTATEEKPTTKNSEPCATTGEKKESL